MSLYSNQSDDVNFKHPDYLTQAPRVEYVYNVFKGIDTARGYLSQAPRESDGAYEIRQDAATLKNFTNAPASCPAVSVRAVPWM